MIEYVSLAAACVAPRPGIENVSPAPAVTRAAPVSGTEYASTTPAAARAAPALVIEYVAPETEYASTSPAAAYAAPVPVTGPLAPVIVYQSVTNTVGPVTESMQSAAAHAAPAPVIDSVAPVMESTSPPAADAAPDPVMEYVTSALAEPIPVDEHMSEQQLAAAVTGVRQRETVLQSLLEAVAPPWVRRHNVAYTATLHNATEIGLVPLMHTQLKSTDWRRAMRASSDVVGTDDRQVRGVAWTRLGELEKKVIKAIEAKLEV